MDVTRRGFLGISFMTGAGIALYALGLDPKALMLHAAEREKGGRVKTSRQHATVCGACSVGCGILLDIDARTGRIRAIEGDPDHPVNEGALCARAAGVIQGTAANPQRLDRVLYRAPFGDRWQVKTWDWAIRQVARRIKSVRDSDFMTRNYRGQVVNRLETIALLGGAGLDNEECWCLARMGRALGLVNLDHQSGLCSAPGAQALAHAFGFGAMSNHWIDIRNSDCILLQGCNPAETHPISCRWIARARERGASVLHVDPRFTRTSALADVHVALRSGTDIAFLGGMINHILEERKFDSQYLVSCTNAPFVVDARFEFNDGLFSGYDPARRGYDTSSWEITRGPGGSPRTDPSLQDPQCVFQLLRKQYDRYDQDTVSTITGVPVKDLKTVYAMLSSTGVPGRAGTVLYGAGLTQHATGLQAVRALCIIQMLLGNMGISGGGVNTFVGPANGQGAMDLGLFSGGLPGYLTAPGASMQTLEAYVKGQGPKTSDRSQAPTRRQAFVSLLKAWYGDRATENNGFGYAWLPKRDEGQDGSAVSIMERLVQGRIRGLLTLAQNPACSLPHAHHVRQGMKNLDWLVHVNLFDNETASFWKGPGADPKGIKTEVFLLPASAFFEKEGSLTNRGRWVQWKGSACQAPGEALSAGDIVYRLFGAVRDLYTKEGGRCPEPIVHAAWDYGDARGRFDPLQVAKAINGRFLRDEKVGEQVFKKGEMVPGAGFLGDRGETSCGCWVLCGAFAQDGTNLMARRKAEDPTGLGLYPHWAWAWPMNSRILYNRASVDKEGKPRDPERPLLVWKDGEWVGDRPDGSLPPEDLDKGRDPFPRAPDGVGGIFCPGLKDGPLPEHYEPMEGPMVKNLLSSQLIVPGIEVFPGAQEACVGCDPRYPFVMTTYTVAEHGRTGAMTRWDPWLTELQPQAFVEIGEELADLRGIRNGDRVRVASARGALSCVAVVTSRLRPLRCGGQVIHEVGMPCTYGWLFPKEAGDSANLLTPPSGKGPDRPPEYKAFMVDVEKVKGGR